ncbi:hypothetical protein ABI125_06675 [Tamlana crocina]
MSGIIFIIGIVLFYWLISGAKSPWSNKKYGGYSGSSKYTTPKTNARIETKTTVTTPKNISVTPTIINTKPDLKLSLVDGQYRVFQNYIVNGTQYTYGFPKDNCNDKRVWIGIGSQELERISYQEATLRLKNQPVPLLAYKPTNNESFNDYDDDLPF